MRALPSETKEEVKNENIFKEEQDPKEKKKSITNRRKESFREKKIRPVNVFYFFNKGGKG